VRSVGAAAILKYSFHLDAVAASWSGNSESTLRVLCRWAHRILVMQDKGILRIDKAFYPKIVPMDVGDDVWKTPLHPSLVDALGPRLQAWVDAGMPRIGRIAAEFHAMRAANHPEFRIGMIESMPWDKK
jgi:hypothetical protein